MNFIRKIERIQCMNKLIQQEKTGTPNELARRLGVCERQLYNLIESIRDMGIEIHYCKKRKTYTYRNIDSLMINFEFKPINRTDQKEITGGCTINSLNCNFVSLCDINFTQIAIAVKSNSCLVKLS